MIVAYLMHSAAWSLAGFLLGWLLGHLGRRISNLEEVVSMPPSSRPAHRPGRSPFTWERVAGVVLVVLSAVTIITAATSAHQLQRTTECQTAYNVALRDLLGQRTESTQRVRQAQRDFIAALAAPGVETLDEARPALDRYRGAIEADAAARDRTPVPAAPNCE